MIRILGVDPGLTNTGWGIVDSSGNRLVYKDHGAIRSTTAQSLPERLWKIQLGLEEIIKQYSPTHIALEETFINANPKSSMRLGYARGVVIATAGKSDLPVYEYAATTVKKSVVGTGHATKDQIASMIKILLPLSGGASKDGADALAIAITHAHLGRDPKYGI